MIIQRVVFLITLFSLLALTGCKDQPVSEDKFIKVYTDIVIAQDTIGQVSTLSQIKKSIFAKNSITEKDYNNTFKYYNENPEKWEAFFDKAIVYLENQRHKKHH